MNEDIAYYRARASDHRARAARAVSDPARIAHMALAKAYERRCEPAVKMRSGAGRTVAAPLLQPASGFSPSA